MVLTGYLAPEGLEHELASELRLAGVEVSDRHERLFLSPDPAIEARWTANTWYEVEELPVASINDAARTLRSIQRNWALYAPYHSGRARLIAEKLPHVSARPLEIGGVAPTAPLGSWMLVEPGRLLAAAACSDPFPNGAPRLAKDRTGPPSRAYAKLWEAFARARRWPGPGDRCLDLGASPGGWTWLVAQTGASVAAVDKAELAPDVAALANVAWRRGSAFAIEPDDAGPVDWLLSDVICYPQRLLGLVQRWLDAEAATNLVCSIKFQGPTDHGVVAEFAAIEGATVRHLHHNKHELTFARVAAQA